MTRTLLTAWSEHRNAVSETLAAATRQLDVFERDLVRVGLDQRTTIERLAAFLAASEQARLRLVVPDFDALRKHLPHFMQLAERWSHRIAVRKTPDHLAHLPDCMLIADARHAVIRFQHDQARSVSLVDAVDETTPYQTRFDELWAECSETLGMRTLGL